MAQVFLNKHESDRIAEEDSYVEPKVETNTKLAEEVDALLDEIDDILEENAEEFVAGYIQKGGE